MTARVWGLRVLVVCAIIAICVMSGSGTPALAIAIVWGPNGIFLAAVTKGIAGLPRFLERVHAWEPVVYRLVGVGWVKRIVATREWPLMNGFEPPPKPASRDELLDRTELSTKWAEFCHAATFVLSLAFALGFLAAGKPSEAGWILVFNVLLNGYPVMLQRANRWRIQQIRANAA